MTFYILISGTPTKLLKTSALHDSCNTEPQEIRGFKCPVTYQTSLLLLAHNVCVFTPQQSPVIFQYKKRRKRQTNHAKYTTQLNLFRIVICGTNHNHYTYFSYRVVTQDRVTLGSIRISLFRRELLTFHHPNNHTHSSKHCSSRTQRSHRSYMTHLTHTISTVQFPLFNTEFTA